MQQVNQSDDFVVIKDLKKSFGEKDVLKGISLEVKRGAFYGLFGKNGAGKSTLFKCILGLISPSSGNIIIDGKNIKKRANVSIGYLPENVSIYGHMTVQDNLRVTALSAGNDLKKSDIKNILEKINLNGRERTLGRDLSLGMKRRLQFAMATMTKQVDMLILDEPTNGMDVNGVIWLKNYLLDLKQRKITILVCSHSLNVMEDLIDEYCIINKGTIAKHELWRKNGIYNYSISIDESSKLLDSKGMPELGEVLEASHNNIKISSRKNVYEIVKILVEYNIEINNIELVNTCLEDIFMESVADHE